MQPLAWHDARRMAAIEDVIILCGGRGTRLQEHTQSIPKPLVEIGGAPRRLPPPPPPPPPPPGGPRPARGPQTARVPGLPGGGGRPRGGGGARAATRAGPRP